MPMVVALIAVAAAFALAVSTLAGGAAREAHAQAIADAAALEGAFAQRRDGSGCASARGVAAANGASVVWCRADPSGDVTVTLRDGAGVARVEADARAGPAFAP